MAFLGGVSTEAKFSNLRDGITVSNGNIEDGSSNVIYDNSNSHVPTTILQDDSLTISGGNGISGAGSVSLGGSNSISVDASDFISTSPDGVSANIGNGLIGDGSNNISIDESFSPNWTGRHVFEGGIEFGSLVLPTDLGNFNFINAEVTSDVVDGDEQSYSFDINGTSVLTVFSIADGAGGIKDKAIKLNGSIKTKDGQTIFDEINSHIPVGTLSSSKVSVSTSGGIEGGGSPALGGSGIDISLINDSITINNTSISLGNSISIALSDLTGFDLSNNDLTYGATTIYNATSGFIPTSTLESSSVTVSAGTGLSGGGSFSLGDSGITISLTNTDITVNGSNGLSGGTVSLGGSISVGISGNLLLDSNLQAVDGETIWDETNTHVPESALQTLSNSALTNSSISINGSSVALGGSTTINVDLGDDEKRLFGANQDVSLRFDSTSDSFIIQDNINVNDILNVDRSTGDVDISGELTEGAAL